MKRTVTHTEGPPWPTMNLTYHISSFMGYHCLCDWQSPSLCPVLSQVLQLARVRAKLDLLLPGQSHHGCLWQRRLLFRAFLLKWRQFSLLSLVLYMDLPPAWGCSGPVQESRAHRHTEHLSWYQERTLLKWISWLWPFTVLRFTSRADSKYMNWFSFGWCQTRRCAQKHLWSAPVPSVSSVYWPG